MTQNGNTLLVQGGLIVTMDRLGTVLDRGDMLVVGDRIDAVGPPGSLRLPSSIGEVIDASGMLVMPGLVNAHSHSQSALSKLTRSRDHTNVITALWYGYAHGMNRDDRDVYVSAALNGIQALRSGVTTIIDQMWFGGAPPRPAVVAAARAYDDLGMRARVCYDFVDRESVTILPDHLGEVPELALEMSNNLKSPPLAEQLAIFREAASDWRDRSDRVSISPASGTALRCTDELLCTLAELAEEFDTVVTVHMLEHLKERASALKVWGCDEIEHLGRIGFLNDRLVGAHVIWVTHSEIDVLAEAGVSVAHNPELNLRLGGALAPIRRMLDAGLNVALGTDSATDQSIFGAMRLASLVHRIGKPNPADWVYASETLRMATNGGARALGFADVIGALEPGRMADFICLDLASPWLVPLTDIDTRLAFFESGRGVDTAVVGGRIVLRDGRLTLIDESKVVEEAAWRGSRLRDRNGALYQMAETMTEILDPDVQALAADARFDPEQ